MLKGEASTFSLELPPYRPPRVLQTLYTSVIDRTLIILWRAVLFAVPAGAVIWLLSNIPAGGASLAEHGIGLLDPFGLLHRAERGDPARLRDRHPRQRDRDPHRAHADGG